MLEPKFRWLTPETKKFMDRGYLMPDQSVQDRVSVICDNAENILKKKGFAKKLERNIEKGWNSLSTPMWANFGTGRGLPISCFGTNVSDSMGSIASAVAEIMMQTKNGGGTSAILNLRNRGALIKDNGHSSGAAHFARMFDGIDLPKGEIVSAIKNLDTAIFDSVDMQRGEVASAVKKLDDTMTIISQGKTRRGNCAVWLKADHPDIMEFLTIKQENSSIQELFFGVVISDQWMTELLSGDRKKAVVWAKILERRKERGLPYLMFEDAANRGTVDCYKDKGMHISHSNLCTEIFLPDSDLESFICCISSMNLLYYDEWKDTDAIETLAYLLEAALTEFINRAKDMDHMQRTVRFAERHRAIGIGRFNWHGLLQSKMIPFESMEAKRLNVEIAKRIKEQCYAASAKMAHEYGEPDVLKGYGRRHSTLNADAPTKSSAFIIGQASENSEAFTSNISVYDLQKGKFLFKNPHLSRLIKEKGWDEREIFDLAIKRGGSVQHIDKLSQHEKSVFKTADEISQMEVLIQASQRQKYIDQGQSLNVRINPFVVSNKDISDFHIEAWKLGLKSLYYQYGVNAAQEFSRDIMHCTACE